MTVEWNDEELLQRIKLAAARGVVAGSYAVETEGNKLMINSPRSGRIYRRRGVVHRSSGPGEPPAPDTGTLVGSSSIEFDLDNLIGIISWRTAYAAWLEFGTEKMEPRPFARPALDNKREAVIADIKERVARVVA